MTEFKIVSPKVDLRRFGGKPKNFRFFNQPGKFEHTVSLSLALSTSLLIFLLLSLSFSLFPTTGSVFAITKMIDQFFPIFSSLLITKVPTNAFIEQSVES